MTSPFSFSFRKVAPYVAAGGIGSYGIYRAVTSKPKSNEKVVIVGGGTAGIGVAAMLRNNGMDDISIIEPKSVHYYQPLWTLVGGGNKPASQSAKPMEDVVPKGTKWIQDSVKAFHPDKNQVTTNDGKTLSYDYLVVASGMQIDWDKVNGLKEGLEEANSGVVSIYDYKYADKTAKTFNFLKDKDSAKYVFTMSPTPIKCAGAPQKVRKVVKFDNFDE
jgi:sulfide:quinone oxidoreductase